MEVQPIQVVLQHYPVIIIMNFHYLMGLEILPGFGHPMYLFPMKNPGAVN
jgi:hypothetical protein